ncbi:MAG: potassium channel family protein [Thiotrichaceae bacterium]|nr:potassium channel family protein [Thiotrichaceae bacterium]
MPRSILYILLRRLRSPLIALVTVYAIFIIGFVLIPGKGSGGGMTFFDAFYFVSYTGTTIGFGELSKGGVGFSPGQRAWTLVAIYATVITWLYGIGSLLTVLQDPAFKRILKHSKFSRKVKELREPFYIICGYGDTGRQLVNALSEENIRSVVIDVDEDKINELEVEDLLLPSLGLAADASRSEVLLDAGIKREWCKGVIALATNESTNLSVAITVQLLNPKARFIARADSVEMQNNILSFGANEVINPFETFADSLSLLIHSPSLYTLFEWLSGVPGDTLAEPFFIKKGHWILSGYGRFGQAVYNHLSEIGVQVRVIEPDIEKRDVPSSSVLGYATEAATLKKAGIEQAVGIIAGTNNDPDNLSTLMTATEINPNIFTIARQTQQQNAEIFKAANLDLVLQRGGAVAHKIFALIRTPLLGDFLRIAIRFKEHKANILVSRIIGIAQDETPKLWEFVIDKETTPALYNKVSIQSVVIADLLRSPRDRSRTLNALPLFLNRGKGNVMLPEDDRQLEVGDRILMCGSEDADCLMQWTTKNMNVLSYLMTGKTESSSHVAKWFNKTFGKSA